MCTQRHTRTLSLIFCHFYLRLHFHHGNCQSRVMTGQASFTHLRWPWPCHSNVRDAGRKVARRKHCDYLCECGFVFHCGDLGTCPLSGELDRLTAAGLSFNVLKLIPGKKGVGDQSNSNWNSYLIWHWRNCDAEHLLSLAFSSLWACVWVSPHSNFHLDNQ